MVITSLSVLLAHEASAVSAAIGAYLIYFFIIQKKLDLRIYAKKMG